MNKNRKTSSIEAKLIEDYFVSKGIEFSELQHAEVFHKDDEVVVRFVDKAAKEKVKTMKATELIAFAYSKSKSIDAAVVLKEVQSLVSRKLEEIQTAVMAEIEKTNKRNMDKIDTIISSLDKGKEAQNEVEDENTI